MQYKNILNILTIQIWLQVQYISHNISLQTQQLMHTISQVFVHYDYYNLCLHKFLIVQSNYKETSPIYQLHITSF